MNLKLKLITAILAGGVILLTESGVRGQAPDAPRGDNGRQRGPRGQRDGARDNNNDPNRRQPPAGDNGGRGQRGGPGGRFRGNGPGFGGMGGMLFREGPITLGEREQFYNRIVDGYLERSLRYYNLNDEQQTQVKSRLDQLKAEQRQYTEPRMAQIEALRQQARAAFQQSRETGQFDRQQMQQIGEQMRQFWDQSPLLNRERVTAEIEGMLPPEQVQRGQAQRLKDEADWQQRRNEMRQRFADGLQPGGPGRMEGRPERDRRRGDGEERGPRGPWNRGERRAERGTGDASVQVEPVEDPLGPWQRYVRDFIRRYQLDASQQATAMSILRDAQNQRDLYESTKRGDLEAARQLTDPALRQKQLDFLTDPVKRMFTSLKKQMETIPTLAQRMAAETPVPPATQPTTATTRPDGADRERGVRPSNRNWERRGGGSDDRPRGRERGDRGERGERGSRN